LGVPAEISLTSEELRLITLLRTRGLSIRNLGPDRREALRGLLTELHVDRGISLTDISKLIGNKTSGYTSWLCRQLGVEARPFEEARLRGIREKRRKYERRPFDGADEDRAYLLGLRHGDLSVSRPWNGVVRVSTSTTHPAMAELFRSLFEPYGHVYQFPRYKKDTGTYEWNVQVILDDSYSFLFQGFNEAKEWIEESEQRTVAYLSGFLDAEGSILVTRNSRGGVVVFVDYFNEDKLVLEWIKAKACEMGLGGSLRINKPIGRGTTGFHLYHNREYWQLSLYSARRILGLIQRLDLRHAEKLARRELALSVRDGMKFQDISEAVVSLRTRIKGDVSKYVRLAEERYLETHPSPSAKCKRFRRDSITVGLS
jgi:hypothetical protein